MLAHGQGATLNSARLASGLGISGKTVRHYVDLLTDLYMVRQLPPWTVNATKRVVRSPKVYVRDSGLLHRLARIRDPEVLLGHPLCGPSWEGFMVETLLAGLGEEWEASFYRTSAGAELDLVLDGPDGRRVAVEIKRTTSPKITKGFRNACADVGATERYFLVPTETPFPLDAHTQAVGIEHLRLD